MSFMLGETPVDLELERNENIPPRLPYYTAEDPGKLIQWTPNEGQVTISLPDELKAQSKNFHHNQDQNRDFIFLKLRPRPRLQCFQDQDQH